MKSFFNATPLFFLTSFVSCFTFLYPSATWAAFSFDRTLSLGMSGVDVQELQKILNSDPRTQISQTGTGSPGNETAYFGALTRAAVIRFQEENSSQILVPNGLSAGTGIVGASTRAVLNGSVQKQAVSVKTLPQNNAIATISTSNAIPAEVLPYISSSTNPNNLKNVGTLLSDIEKVSKEQGLSGLSMQQAKDAVLKVVATSTDLREAFIADAQKHLSSRTFQRSLFGDALNDLVSGVKKSLVPIAFAQVGSPFGGALLSPIYCTASENWLLDIQPLAPTYAALLTYQIGSQIYMTFDLPFTLELLGHYSFGNQCIEGEYPYVITVPSQGAVSPETGSS